MSRHRIGILTGGGDAPGLNAVIRAVVKYGAGGKHWDVFGSEDAFNGLLDDPPRLQRLTPRTCQGLLHRGGTILGTTNKVDPFAVNGRDGVARDESARLAERVRLEGLEGLIVIGGDGTQAIAWRLMQERGVQVVGVPKTIDNDLAYTDYTFGFWSAVEVATDALDRLHTTAEAHDRVMLVEVMGRDAGWIALHAGVAGGADCIAIPEIPYDPDLYVGKIRQRQRRGRQFSMVVVAEGARPRTGQSEPSAVVHGKGSVPAGGAAQQLARLLAERIDVETRVTVLGHLQRGGSPVSYDRVLATRFGVHAVDLIDAGRWGELVRLEHDRVTSVPLSRVVGQAHQVDPDDPLVRAARAVGIELGG